MIPRRLETDNGPHFNSSEFAKFAKEEGFKHHRVTPLHPQANSEAESFMKVLNKTEQIAHLQHANSKTALQNMLMGYRSTPHLATGVSPYTAMMNRTIRTKLDAVIPTDINDVQRGISARDKQYKKAG